MALPIMKRFPTTAARLAYNFKSQERGYLVDDLEASHLYYVYRSGTGASTCIPMPREFGWINFNLRDFHETDSSGDVGNLADTGGGQLASDSTPTYIGATTTEAAVITWEASNSDIIMVDTCLPGDFDDTRDCYVDLVVSSGTTDAATIGVLTSWDGGSQVTDTATGTNSASEQSTTATIAAADVPASAGRVTIQLVPGSHTTNVIALHRARLRYYRK